MGRAVGAAAVVFGAVVAASAGIGTQVVGLGAGMAVMTGLLGPLVAFFSRAFFLDGAGKGVSGGTASHRTMRCASAARNGQLE